MSQIIRVYPCPSVAKILAEHPLDHAVAGVNCFGEFIGFGAAAFGHVGFAAAATADYRGDLADDVSGFYFGGQIVGDADDYANLAFVVASDDYDAGF